MPKVAPITAQTIALFHMLARQCSKSFKPGFNSTWTENFQMYKLDLDKAEEPEIKLPAFTGSQRKQGNSRKTSTSSSATTQKTLTLWITINYGKFFKRQEYQTTLPVYWETCMQVRKQQLELDMEQLTGSKIGPGVCQDCITSSSLFNLYMQSTLCEMPGWMKHKLESRLSGEISITSEMQMTPPLWQKAKKN